MIGFKLRRNEIRTGMTELPTKKVKEMNTENQTVTTTYMVMPIANYGLDGCSVNLLEGLTYQPLIKAMMSQTMGPMTSLIMLNYQKQYREKWESAVRRCFGNFPSLETLINVVKNSNNGDLCALFPIIADILQITTSRSANRAFFPVIFLLKTLYTEAEMKKMVNKVQTGDTSEFDNGFVGLAENRSWENHFSYSGYCAFAIYNMCSKMNWIIRVPSLEVQSIMVKQLIFHSIWGTYKEDQGILAGMTSTNLKEWYSRRQMNIAMKSIAEMNYITTNLLTINLYSKLATAQQTELLGRSQDMVMHTPVFSGVRRHTNLDLLFTHLDRNNGKNFRGMASNSLSTLIAEYTALLDHLRKIIGNDNEILMGTTNWYNTIGLSLISPGTASNEVATASGQYFFRDE
uniref:Nucleoprotein n=1 Tax=Neuropteran orthomyxo-related virus OKIAV190 TaxID=2792560 RepID=A0A7T0M3H8_9ORTO|nr:nucleoprotein [Neuropteran orthomyxo-related virus OKIAV190]